MSSYSLLQVSLDQTISRESLEEASTSVSSIARADCVIMQRDLFGILISGLPLDDAKAFQAALKRFHLQTDIVADEQIPILHEAFTIQRIDLKKDKLVFTDMMGREQVRPIEDLVFVAGGFLTRTRTRAGLVVVDGETPGRPQTQEEIPEFRLDFFFWSSPNRLRASVSSESLVFFRERPLRLRDTALLLGAMMDLAELLPGERVGSGLKRTDTNNCYLSLRSYEEEIRWHFYRLKGNA
jgi:hypothetical protein